MEPARSRRRQSDSQNGEAKTRAMATAVVLESQRVAAEACVACEDWRRAWYAPYAATTVTVQMDVDASSHPERVRRGVRKPSTLAIRPRIQAKW